MEKTQREDFHSFSFTQIEQNEFIVDRVNGVALTLFLPDSPFFLIQLRTYSLPLSFSSFLCSKSIDCLKVKSRIVWSESSERKREIGNWIFVFARVDTFTLLMCSCWFSQFGFPHIRTYTPLIYSQPQGVRVCGCDAKSLCVLGRMDNVLVTFQTSGQASPFIYFIS